jgi:hypothetical protein
VLKRQSMVNQSAYMLNAKRENHLRNSEASSSSVETSTSPQLRDYSLSPLHITSPPSLHPRIAAGGDTSSQGKKYNNNIIESEDVGEDFNAGNRRSSAALNDEITEDMVNSDEVDPLISVMSSLFLCCVCSSFRTFVHFFLKHIYIHIHFAPKHSCAHLS